MSIRTVLILVTLMLVLVTSVEALPVRIDKVEIDGTVITSNAVNRFDVVRGQTLPIAVTVTAVSDVNNLEVEAFITGFEFNDVERVSDLSAVFDAKTNVTYVKRLSLKLPDSLDKDDYKLRIIVSDRNGDEVIQNYDLKIDVPRHLVTVEDVLLTPENEITAGSALLVSVRVENNGGRAEEDVKVRVSIPGLGVSATKYLNKVGIEDDAETEEVYLRLPECATPGTYDVIANIHYADGHRTAMGKAQIVVLKNELCDDETISSEEESKIIISVDSNHESIELGAGVSVVFPVKVENKARTSKSFTFIPSADWASVKVSPSTTAVLAPGKTQTLYISVTPKADTAVGTHAVTAVISSSGQIIKQVPLTVTVIQTPDTGISFKRALEVGLIVLLVLLIIVGLIVGFTLLRDEEPPQEKSELYY